MNSPILISNSFPFSLIRRRVVVEPSTVPDLLTAMHARPWVSAWGHQNTVDLASKLLSADLRTRIEKPTLTLQETRLPQFEGNVFSEVWLLSITPIDGLSREEQREIQPHQIKDWQVLRLVWEETSTLS